MTQEFVRDATRGLTNEQWLFKPAPLRWSIAQCVDHLARTEEYVLQLIRDRVLTSNEPLLGAFPYGSKTGSTCGPTTQRYIGWPQELW